MADGEFNLVQSWADARIYLPDGSTQMENSYIAIIEVHEFMKRMMEDYEQMGVKDRGLVAAGLVAFRLKGVREVLDDMAPVLYEALSLVEDL